MAERGIRKSDRFRWWNSDRSGFQYGFVPLTTRPNAYTREQGRPVRDHGVEVSPDEYDQPPPSNRPLGGEGEIGTGARARSNFDTDSNVYFMPSEYLIPVQYLSVSTQIRWNDNNVPIYISGSNQAVSLSSNPQITSGTHDKYISVQCVGSNVTLVDGQGISIDFNVPAVVMQSGGVATLIYNATDSLWHMTSFNPQGGF